MVFAALHRKIKLLQIHLHKAPYPLTVNIKRSQWGALQIAMHLRPLDDFSLFQHFMKKAPSLRNDNQLHRPDGAGCWL